MKWIWLSETLYPDCQKNYSNINACPREKREKFTYCVAQFKKEYSFEKKITNAKISISADSFFHLFVNGEFTGLGPVTSGGDFLCYAPAPKHYKNRYELTPGTNTLSFDIDVRLLPEKLTDYSRYHGGLALDCELTFNDGSTLAVCADDTWLCRKKTSYNGFCSYDSTLAEDGFSEAVFTEDIWHAEEAPIPMLSFTEVSNKKYTVAPGEKFSDSFELDKIYGVYPIVKTSGKCDVTVETNELPGQEKTIETLRFGKADSFFSFLMHSCGNTDICIENTDTLPVTVEYTLLAPWYPITQRGSFECSDRELNKVYDVCAHTLKICRQTLHLDSTKHQEHLACTGDYYIESLMTLYMYGDMRLSEFDVMRTSDMLVQNEGWIFHTTYSLIWVRMLLDVYTITGNSALLTYCENGLDALLDRFDSYLGDNGLVESPHDFMFVDWTVIDGYSMHHPPKALGQTVLNAFYYDALLNASKVYSLLGKEDRANAFISQAEKFKITFNDEFFDESRGLYFDGKNDVYGGYDHYMPENSAKRYFSKYPNILACLYGLCDGEKAKEILENIIFNDELQDIQPYFMHYMLCAVRKHGLFAKYGMKLLDRWKPVVNECDKGLKEGWIAPEPTYSFDHSHAWGGTAAYQLPSAISGMKILEPGMKKLSFEPKLFGLDYANIDIPTKFGFISLRLKKDCVPEITAPEEIEIEFPKTPVN